jgi:signal transduction histidine kinase
MLKDFLSRGFLYWLRAPRGFEDVRRDELVLGGTRLVLSIFCLAAFFVGSRFSPPYLQEVLLFSYFIYSSLILVFVSIRKRLSPLTQIVIHYINILWAMNLIYLVGIPEISYACFFYTLIAAAIRWGFWETQVTNLLFWTQLLIGVFIYNRQLPLNLYELEIWDVLPKVLLSFALAFIVGSAAELKAVRSENSILSNIMDNLRSRSGLDRAIQSACAVAFRLYGATQILVAISAQNRKHAGLFRATNAEPAAQPEKLVPSELPRYFFPCSASTWRTVSISQVSPPQLRCTVLEGGGTTKMCEGCQAVYSLLAAYPFQVLLAASLSFSDDVHARVYIIDPIRFFAGRAGMQFLERSVRRLAPQLLDLYLVSRLRAKAEAAAGTRMAREIHDGIIQSLSAVNMQVEELRTHSEIGSAQEAERVARIQETVRRAIADLRKLGEELRSLDIDSSRLLGYLAGLTVKFRLEHGIEARFVPEVDEVHLETRVCVELARIVQEALINVRKHSKASEVLVRFGRRDGSWILNVMDNGIGYGFAGRLGHEEMQSQGKGPRMILERAQGINARVSLESFEKGGSCLEVTFRDAET